MDHILEGLCPMETSRLESFNSTTELQNRGFHQLGTNNTVLTGGVTCRRCHLQEVHLQVIPLQYADIHRSIDRTKTNLHHRLSYLYDYLLIKQDVPVKQAFVLIFIILPVLFVVIIIYIPCS